LTALIICGSIVLFIALVMMIRVGVDFSYIESALRLNIRICGFPLKVLPREGEKLKKKSKAKSEKKQGDGEESEKKSFSLPFNKDEIIALLKALFRGIGRFGRKLKVEKFHLHYTAGGSDPYKTAVTFGSVNAVLSAVAPICAARVRVRDCDVWTNIDFMSEKTKLDAAVIVSIRIGQAVAAALRIAFAALKIFRQNRRRLRAEARLMYANSANAHK